MVEDDLDERAGPEAPGRARARIAGAIAVLAVVCAISIDRADYILIADRWVAVGVAIVGLLVAEWLLRFPVGSVVFGYGVIGLSPDLIGAVQIGPIEIVTAVLALLIVFRVRVLSVERGTLRALRVPVIAWAVVALALAAGSLVATLSSPALTTSALGELLRWWLAPAAALAVLIAQPRWAVGVIVGLLVSVVAHSVLIYYQAATFATIYQERPYGLLSSGSSLSGEIIANPNAAGVAAAMLAVFALGIVAERAPRWRSGERLAIPLLAAAAMASVASVFTLSRSGWVFVFIGCIIVAVRARAKWAFLVLVAAVALVLALPMTQGRLIRTLTDTTAPEYSGTTIEQQLEGRSVERVSITRRFEAWEIAVEEAIENGPIVGIGPQGLPRLAGTPADNSYLEAFVDAGAVGAVALIVLALATPFAVARAGGSTGSVAVTGAFAAIGLLGNYWFDPRLLFLWMIVVGLGLAGRSPPPRKYAR